MDACVTRTWRRESYARNVYRQLFWLLHREENLEQLRAKRAAQERDMLTWDAVERFRYKPTKAKTGLRRVAKVEKIREKSGFSQTISSHAFGFHGPHSYQNTVISLEV